jgi:hypothetical protein
MTGGGWDVKLPEAIHQGVSGNPAPGIYISDYKVINLAKAATIVKDCTTLRFVPLTLTVTADQNTGKFTVTGTGTDDGVGMVLSGSGQVTAKSGSNPGDTQSGTISATITVTYTWPMAETRPATKVTEQTATLNGVVVRDGGLCCEYRFAYWPDGGKPVYTSWTGSVKQGFPLTAAVKGLTPGTLYYFRVEIRNAEGNYTHNKLSFVTTARIAISSTDGGNVVVPGEGTFLKPVGTVMPVEAQADAGWAFVGWTGTAVDAGLVADPTAAATNVVLKGDTTLQANFKIKVIWVSFHGTDTATANAATAGFTDAPDKGYTDLLKDAGYAVVRYVQTGTPDVNMLNTASLVIISRSVASGSFNTAAATRWNTQITAPMIVTNGYLTRKARLGFMTGSTLPDSTGNIKLTVVVPNHPIFEGIALTDGTMDANYAGICTYPDGVTVARGISIVTEPADTEAKVLATVSQASASTGPAWAVMIAEYPAGATVEHDGPATDVLAGPRLIFLTGSREANGKNSEGTGMIDLTDAGKQLFLNAVKYMLPGFSDDFETPVDYVVDDLGAYAGILDAANILALNASISRPGALFMQTANGVWDPGPGPMLYVNVSGDFVATVKVTDFAGTLAAPVFHNDSGILARDPASDGGVENWVSMNYFPTWTAFIARNTTNGVRAELGATTGTWTGADTFALVAQYPYIQLERKGNDFSFRISSDGVNFLPLTDPGFLGIYDGTQTPLVVSRPDLPIKLQVGLMSATYTADAGYVAFDDFKITQ